MSDIKIITTPVFPENPNNPARAYIYRDVIEINRQAFDKMPKYAQDYVMRHERGHALLDTMSEQRADEYAIENGDRKVKNGLWKDYKTVAALAGNDKERLKSAELKLTALSAARGNRHAEAYLGQNANATGVVDGNGVFVITFYILLLVIGFLTLLV